MQIPPQSLCEQCSKFHQKMNSETECQYISNVNFLNSWWFTRNNQAESTSTCPLNIKHVQGLFSLLNTFLTIQGLAQRNMESGFKKIKSNFMSFLLICRTLIPLYAKTVIQVCRVHVGKSSLVHNSVRSFDNAHSSTNQGL